MRMNEHDSAIETATHPFINMWGLVLNLIAFLIVVMVFLLISNSPVSDSELNDMEKNNQELKKKWEECYGQGFLESGVPVNENRRQKIKRLREEGNQLVKELLPFIGVGLTLGEEILRFESARAVPPPDMEGELLKALEQLKNMSLEECLNTAQNKPSEDADRATKFSWYFAYILDFMEKSKNTARETERGFIPQILVEGHTDNVPITSPFRDNWELSYNRARYLALKIKELLDSKGYVLAKDYHMTMAGCAESVPIIYHTGITPEQQNRRIELWLYKRSKAETQKQGE
jgi:hypothetical protein